MREKVECELEERKQELDIKGTGAVGAHPWKGEEEWPAWGQRVQSGWSINVRWRRGESRSWSHLLGLGVLCTPCL